MPVLFLSCPSHYRSSAHPLLDLLETQKLCAGLAAERGLHDFRRGLVGLSEAAEREEAEAAAEAESQQQGQAKGPNGSAKGSAASASSVPFRLALALGDVRRRLAQDRGAAGDRYGRVAHSISCMTCAASFATHTT